MRKNFVFQRFADMLQILISLLRVVHVVLEWKVNIMRCVIVNTDKRFKNNILTGLNGGVNLKDLKKIAKDVSTYTGGGRLDAAQLVKHCLALISSAKRNGNDGKFRLVYIYHDIVDKKIAKEHKEGLDKFVETANLGRRFLHLTYSQFLGRLKNFLPQIYDRREDREKYIKFLVHRYADLRVEELLVH